MLFIPRQRPAPVALTWVRFTAGVAEERRVLDRFALDLDQRARLGAGPSVALFDLDRTLVRGSSAVALARALVSHGAIRRRELLGAAARDNMFRRRGSSDATAERFKRKVLRVMSGHERGPLLEIAEGVAMQLVAEMSPAARSLVDRHLLAGDFTVVLSASPHELVEGIVSALGAHRAVGTRAEHVDGRFTGELNGPFCYGPSKLERLRMELGAVELDRAWAYADSASDLPVLRAASHPVAVNPDRALSHVAQDEGWPVFRC
jgi:HAD superfamily hydrolase (TIGR01490 family)